MARTGPLTRDTSAIALGLAQVRVGAAAPYISQSDPVFGQADSMGALGTTKFTSAIEQWKLTSGFPALEDMSIPTSETCSLEVSFKEVTPKNLALARGLSPFDDVDATVSVVNKKTTSGTLTGDIAVNNSGGVKDEVYTVVFTSATAFKVFGESAGLIGTHSGVNSQYAPKVDNKALFTIPANYFSGTWATDETFTFATTAFVAGSASYDNNKEGEISLGAMKAPEFIRMEAMYVFPDGSHYMCIIFPRANVSMAVELDMQAADAASSPITFEAKRADSATDGGHSTWDSRPIGRIKFGLM